MHAATYISSVVHHDEFGPFKTRLSVAGVRGFSVVLLVEEVQQVLVGERSPKRGRLPAGERLPTQQRDSH